MGELIHDFIFDAARRAPSSPALVGGAHRQSYAELAEAVADAAQLLLAARIPRGGRVAVFLEKRVEHVAACFGAAAAGAVFVPVNPLLKADQLAHILNDCGAAILVTSPERLLAMASTIVRCSPLRTVFVTGPLDGLPNFPGLSLRSWTPAAGASPAHRVIDTDMAAILYTSGSTGRPKGVVLSHRNMVAGAASVTNYLQMTARDRVLAVLPLSFDYGLSQLTTAFHAGACVVLLNHLFHRDIVKAVADERITGLAAVPPLWTQLSQLTWPENCTLRYLTSSGGAMPARAVAALRSALPAASLYLMYGLTEAFRSTYLQPGEIDQRPGSIGRAVPNAEVMVVRPDGSLCEPDEPGELVHRGAFVALGYWNAPAATAERFRPVPGQDPALPIAELAVWSGDTVRQDVDGYFYFIGREDDMIKVSGYRVSPHEIEEALLATDLVGEVAAFGVPHPEYGQVIVLVAVAQDRVVAGKLMRECQRRLPSYMVPAHIAISAAALPRNANGKVDRKAISKSYLSMFES